MMNELDQLTPIKSAIEKAQTPQEHDWIDRKLAELAEMGRREDAKKSQMDLIAETRIDNLRAMGDKLDELREEGILKPGPDNSLPEEKIYLPPLKRRVLADELNDWPEESHPEYGTGLIEFIQSFKNHEINELTVTGAYRIAKEYRLRKERKDAEVEGFEHPDVLLFNADFREVLPKLEDETVSMIFTDPPYAEEFKILYRDLADLSRPVVSEGGSLLAYIGHFAAPDIFRYFSAYPEWRYWWLLAIDQRHHGGRRILEGKNVRVHWKPIIWYVKGGRFNTEYVDDMINSRAPAKELHEWEQSTIEAEYYIEFLSEPGGWVLDPMMGSGTTGIAALNKGRKFIGIEQDKSRYNVASNRIKEWLKNNS
jgi:16S rRNA G966 N2-methylase RsmD